MHQCGQVVGCVQNGVVFNMSPDRSTTTVCKHCNSSNCIRTGKRGNTQKLLCKTCNKHQQTIYINQRYTEADEENIRTHHNEGLGIRSIGRLLGITITSVQMLMERKAAKLKHPEPSLPNRIYLLDELQTFVGRNKESYCCYIISTMDKRTGKIVSVAVGRRNQKTIRQVTDTLNHYSPKRIVIDGWNGYAALIPKAIHKITEFGINRLERLHLNLRQRLKRLSRKTMSWSKSERMLVVSICLYFEI
jgi:insertion element IS1 protein InsB